MCGPHQSSPDAELAHHPNAFFETDTSVRPHLAVTTLDQPHPGVANTLAGLVKYLAVLANTLAASSSPPITTAHVRPRQRGALVHLSDGQPVSVTPG